MCFALDHTIEHLSGNTTEVPDLYPEPPLHDLRYRVIKKSSETGHFRVFHDEYGAEKLERFLNNSHGVDPWRGIVSILYLKGDEWEVLTELPFKMNE